MTVRDMIGDEKFEGLKSLVHRTFPDEKCAPSDALVSAVVCALPEQARVALGVADGALDVLKEAVERLTTPEGPGAVRAMSPTYFRVHATHRRVGDGAGAHEFTSVLPMVRVALPETEQLDLLTDIGVVFAGDHHLYTRRLVLEKYADVIEAVGYELGDVFLTTPARYLGARFGAIAIYELFDTRGQRRGWILESGMATGEPRVLYCSPKGNRIARKSWYEPTPFSSPDDYYRGEVTFTGPRHGDLPAQLNVRVATADELAQARYHVEVQALFATAHPTPVFPAELTAQAALRVAAIAVARGSDDPIFNLLAPFGRALSWQKKPA